MESLSCINSSLPIHPDVSAESRVQLPNLLITACFHNLGILSAQPFPPPPKSWFLNILTRATLLKNIQKHSLLFSQLIESNQLIVWILSTTFLITWS